MISGISLFEASQKRNTKRLSARVCLLPDEPALDMEFSFEPGTAARPWTALTFQLRIL
jgi:hypothetical protein